MRAAAIILALAAPVSAEQIAVPSGQAVTLHEVITDVPGPAGDTHRYRFLAPGIARANPTVSKEEIFADIDHLCAAFVIPGLAGSDSAPSQIIISLSDQPADFGAPNPEITQFFEAYTIQGAACIWEGF